MEVNAISQGFGVVLEKELWVRLGEFDFGATETRWDQFLNSSGRGSTNVTGLCSDMQGRLCQVASRRRGRDFPAEYCGGARWSMFFLPSVRALNVEANLRTGQFPFEGRGECGIIESFQRCILPRAAVKSMILLFHTWGFVSLAVQPASQLHFSGGIPPNCFLGV